MSVSVFFMPMISDSASKTIASERWVSTLKNLLAPIPFTYG